MQKKISMIARLRVLLLFLTVFVEAQYTDQINSNRPGASIGAFAVGKGIVQFEGGLEYRKYNHQDYNNSTIDGNIIFLSVRWGFLSERFELTYQG
ncbi:MAG: transporter, partial [Bacteroidetes bacterium]|nr:transporter [Bacteroidota bacterium]